MGRILEGFWDCKYCGTTRIGGRRRQCPNCSKARDDNTTFYLDTTKNRYVPEKKAIKINKNPDWICNYCNQLNSDNDDVCIYCGATRTSENLNYFENKEKKKQQKQECTEENNQEEVSEKNSWQSSLHNLKNYSIPNFFAASWKPVLITLLIVISILGIFLLFKPKEYEITINELSWERSINIERYQTVQESNWYLPADGRLIYSYLEYSHSEQVLDHYETRTRSIAKERISGYETYVSGYRDLGNGYFEEITSQRPIYETYYETETYEEPVYRSEPVYRTKYYYEIDKWLYERSVVTTGTDKSPYWGDTHLATDERTSSQTEKYIVKGVDTKTEKEISFSLSLDVWSTLEIEQTIKVKITFGHGEILE